MVVFALTWVMAAVAPCLTTAPCHASDAGEATTKLRSDCATIAALDCQLSYQQIVRSENRAPEMALAAPHSVIRVVPLPRIADKTPDWPTRLALASTTRPQPVSFHLVLRL